MIKAVALATPELGDRSYLLHDGHVAAVIDPQRDIERVLRLARAEGVRIACVAETHIHNDYVSGGWALSQRLGVPYLVAAEEAVDFARRPVRHGDIITVGASFSLGVFATPGHTPHHLSYVALEGGLPVSVCTGGSMLFGSAGRTDLSGESQTVPLARRQYRTLHRLGRLPDEVAVLPTHGFGSFCAVASSGDRRRIDHRRATSGESGLSPGWGGRLRRRAHRRADRVSELLPPYGHPEQPGRCGAGSLPAPRSSTRSDSPPWRSPRPGWSICDRAPTSPADTFSGRSISSTACSSRPISAGSSPMTRRSCWWGRAVRSWRAPNSIWPASGSTTWLGAMSDTSHLAGPPAPTPSAAFGALHEAMCKPGVVALDVRRQDEWDGGHLEGALHLPLHELGANIREIPRGTVWVHCAAGFRAGIAASLLERAGRRVVLVNDTFAPCAGSTGTHEHERRAAKVA